MVRDGWAMAFVRYSRDYVVEEKEARDARRGLWIGTFSPPWEWRTAQRSN
jgi:endonuclease YncB( thermonuclease family)